MRRFEATITIAIHGMVSFMLDQPVRADDADNPLRVVYMGPLTRHDEFAERFGCRVYTAYGMTEVPVPIVSALDPVDDRSCGRNADPENYELRLVDEHDVPVPVGTPGELIVRNSRPWTINSGYKNMPEATANAWRNGWFHTGDEFLLDEEGNFFFLDRMKDVIRRRGVNISSFEVEEEVRSHPAVKDVAAVAVSNPDMEESAGDEEVKVVVVLEDDTALDPAELVEYLTPRMPQALAAPLRRVLPGASAHGVVQGAQGRPPRCRRHGRYLGSRGSRPRALPGGALTTPEADPDPLDETTGEPRIVGARCTTCDAVAFPLRPSCLACGGSVERILLPRNGELWTWTTQGFEPKAPYVGEPGEFVPYAVGYVELPGALRVEGLLTESDPARLRIGQAMEVVAIVQGGVRTYAFAPTEP